MSEAPIATYARMDEGTVEDYAIMASYKPANLAAMPDRLMGLLMELGDKQTAARSTATRTRFSPPPSHTTTAQTTRWSSRR